MQPLVQSECLASLGKGFTGLADTPGLIHIRQSGQQLQASTVDLLDLGSADFQHFGAFGGLLSNPGQQFVTRFDSTVNGHFFGKLKGCTHD